MKLYRLSQSANNGYDTYDSAVVVAKDESDARKIHPSGDEVDNASEFPKEKYSTWCQIEMVRVEYLGTAKMEIKRGVICASFNAG